VRHFCNIRRKPESYLILSVRCVSVSVLSSPGTVLASFSDGGGKIVRVSKFKLLPALAASGLIGIGAATAADLPVKAPPLAPAPAFSWSGCYIGANAGYGWQRNRADLVVPGDPGSQAFYVPTITAGALPTSISFDRSGFIGGGQIGCNYQVQRFVYGIEADFDGAHISGSTTTTTNVPPAFLPGVFTAGSTLNWLGTVRGRVGFTPSDRSLVYATGGLAYGATNHTYSLAFANPPFNDAASSNVTDTKAGYVVGAGIEWAFYQNWSVKAEYLYYNLGRSTDVTVPGGRTLTLVNAGTVRSLSNTFSDSGNLVRVGVNYRFNWAQPVVAKY
jgi:outer membrane immunogenic protein